MKGRRLLLASMACLALVATRAGAVDEFKRNSNVWKNNDNCARQAFKKFPDYTPESNAKRDHEMQQCLAGANAPPRASTDPKPVASPDQQPQ